MADLVTCYLTLRFQSFLGGLGYRAGFEASSPETMKAVRSSQDVRGADAATHWMSRGARCQMEPTKVFTASIEPLRKIDCPCKPITSD